MMMKRKDMDKDMGKGDMDDKDAWIARKIAMLIREGKSKAQAAAVAFSMWKDMQSKKK